jgi:hypothetical protein
MTDSNKCFTDLSMRVESYAVFVLKCAVAFNS